VCVRKQNRVASFRVLEVSTLREAVDPRAILKALSTTAMCIASSNTLGE